MTISNRLEPRAVGRDACVSIDDATALETDYTDYWSDESRVAGCAPASLAFPKSLSELAEIMAQHHAQGHAVLVSGARTGVVGGAVVQPGMHLVSTDRLCGVDSVGEDAQGESFVRVRAGTSLVELNAYLDQHHPELVFPVDPTESSASIGGMVSTNASGTRSLRYGATRRWVRALDVVLVDGRLLELRRGAVRAAKGVLWLEDGDATRRLEADPIPKPPTKHALGYCFGDDIDAIDLFIGAEGTLGAVARVELGLTRRPALSLYYLQFFPHDEGAFQFVEWLRRDATLTPAAIEYFDDRSLDLLVERVPPARSRFVGLIDQDCRAAIYTELELEDDAALEAALDAIAAAVDRAGGSLDRSVGSTEPADWRAMKQFRHAVPEQINATIAARKRSFPQLHKISTDMAVPGEQLRQIHALYREILQAHGLEYFIFGHIGDNHFHVNITPRDADELALALALYREVAQHVCRLGGAVAAEHGIGRLKRAFLALQYPPEQLETMRRIKRFFDPAGLLNPGVLLAE